jgi:hypothetical protein
VVILSKASDDVGNTLLMLIDKLAGKGSNIRLSFEDLTLELGMAKAKLNGSVVFDVQYVNEKE